MEIKRERSRNEARYVEHGARPMVWMAHFSLERLLKASAISLLTSRLLKREIRTAFGRVSYAAGATWKICYFLSEIVTVIFEIIILISAFRAVVFKLLFLKESVRNKKIYLLKFCRLFPQELDHFITKSNTNFHDDISN